MADRVRLFFGMPLPPELLARALAVQSELRRWRIRTQPRAIAERNLHLTLKFMGWLSESDVDTLARGLHDCTPALSAITVTARALGAFPKPRHARVIALELDDPESQLSNLASQIEDLAESVGVPRESRPFKAHATIARLSQPADVRAELERSSFAPLEVTFDRVRLYQSILSSSGSEYGARAEAVLSAD